MFGKLFKKNNEAPKSVSDAIDGIESGIYSKIYPILKPGDWVGIKAGALRKTVVGTQENPQVVIAYGYDTPENFIFLTPKHLETMDGDQVIKSAFENLESHKTEFTPAAALNNLVLTASGTDFSSERILSTTHMQAAHKQLNSDELWVSIPRRRCMMVVSKHTSENILNQFLQLHLHAWKDDSYGNAPISPDLFLVKNGEIVATQNVS